MGSKRKQIRDDIDISKCQPICKNHGINLFLDNKNKEEINSLINNYDEVPMFVNFL